MKKTVNIKCPICKQVLSVRKHKVNSELNRHTVIMHDRKVASKENLWDLFVLVPGTKWELISSDIRADTATDVIQDYLGSSDASASWNLSLMGYLCFSGGNTYRIIKANDPLDDLNAAISIP